MTAHVSISDSDRRLGWTERLVGACRLDPAVYEEVEANHGATGQAIGTVLLSALAGAVGLFADQGWQAVGAAMAGGCAGWLLWSWIVYEIGGRWMAEPQTRADWGEVLRTTGFASAPGMIRILALIPGLRALVLFVSSVWILAAFVVAVRQALDYKSTLRAAVVCVLGGVAYGLFVFVLPEACSLR